MYSMKYIQKILTNNQYNLRQNKTQISFFKMCIF